MSSRKGRDPASKRPSIKVRFIAGFGPIVRDAGPSRQLYVKDLSLPLEEIPGGYLHTEALDGVKHFALGPLAQAAESCFGATEWPGNVPVPQAWLECEVDDVAAATAALRDQGYRLLVAARTEPWGQTVTRFLGPEGLLVGVTHTPSMQRSKS